MLLDFLISHWFLFSLLFGLLLSIVWVEAREQAHGVSMLTIQEAVCLMNKQKAVVIDMREKAYYAEGHILHAISVLQKAVEAPDEHLLKYKNKPIILVCQTGQQISKAGINLKKAGFKEVYGLKGGMQAWRDAGFPLVQTSS